MKWLIVASALSTLAAVPSVQDPTPSAPGARLEIHAVATDRKGNLVQDLKEGDVEVWIERHRIPIEELTMVSPSDERSRRSIVLLMDDITLRPEDAVRARDVARQFVNRMALGDQMAIVTLDGRTTSSTEDRTELVRSINAYNVRATGPLRPDDLSAQVLGTLAAISRRLSESAARRRTIVAIGPGGLFDTPIPPSSVGRDLRREWTDAVRAMAQNDVTLYVIDPGGVGRSRVTSGDNGFARETGGRAFSNTNDTQQAVAQIMRDAVAYYTIAVLDPPLFRTAELRSIDVRVRKPGVTIRTARYLAGAPR